MLHKVIITDDKGIIVALLTKEASAEDDSVKENDEGSNPRNLEDVSLPGRSDIGEVRHSGFPPVNRRTCFAILDTTRGIFT